MPIEREAKLAVPEGFVLPDLRRMAGGIRVADRGTQLLEATYWDTDSLALFRHQFGLRHRTRDGKNGTWTLKGPSTADGHGFAREETEVPGTPDSIPAALLEAVRTMLAGADPHPVARVRTERHVLDLSDGAGHSVEVADDRVTVIDAKDEEVARFREVEVEQVGDGAESLADAMVGALETSGAEAEATSKYTRALVALGLVDEGRPTG